ncbi:MAG: hypothetical protein PVJ40_10770 [Gammaproteobacteria bacterium]|jgi:hypothetical protein
MNAKRYEALRRRPLFAPLWLPILIGVAVVATLFWAIPRLQITTVVVIPASTVGGDLAAIPQPLDRLLVPPGMVASAHIVATATGAELEGYHPAPEGFVDIGWVADEYHGQTVAILVPSDMVEASLVRLGVKTYQKGRIYLIERSLLSSDRVLELGQPPKQD